MKCNVLHSWNVNRTDALKIQKVLSGQIRRHGLQAEKVRFVAGADVSYSKDGNEAFAAIVVMDLLSFESRAMSVVVSHVTFPYLPGLLAFREGPPLLEAWKRLRLAPDVVLMDGQGVAHPAGCGLASHLGLWFDCPTIGCAKTLLLGEYLELAREAGSTAPLRYHRKQVGAALRTKTRTKPVFISIGHRTDLENAIAIVKRCSHRFRIPEPLRQANLMANRLRASRYQEARKHGTHGSEKI